MSPKWISSLGIALPLLSGCAVVQGHKMITQEGDVVYYGVPSDHFFRVEGGLFRVRPTGKLGLEDTGGATSSMSVNDIGAQESVTTPYLKASFRFGANELSGFVYHTESAGTGVLSKNFGTIPAGSQVGSEVELLDVKALYKWYWIDVKNFSFGPGGGIEYLKVSGAVDPAAPGATEHFSAEAPVPMVGFSTEFRFQDIKIFGDFYGLRGTIGELNGNALDFEAGAKYTPFKNLDISAGYRFVQFQADGVDAGRKFQADYRLPGFYLGASIRF